MMVSQQLIDYICLVHKAKWCMERGIELLIEVPHPWTNRPKGFPRGRLACVNSRGKQARYVNAKKAYDYFMALELEARAEQ